MTTSTTYLGIDVGGTGIKGALVDTSTGELLSDRIRFDTPQPATPTAVVETIDKIVNELAWEGALGVTLPAVIINETVCSAANLDKSWIGINAKELLQKKLTKNKQIVCLNDADAALIAENYQGTAKDFIGPILMVTIGTGIGSALMNKSVLYPNTEFGHIEINGKEAEDRASTAIKKKNDWSTEKWANQLNKVLIEYEKILNPELIILGGGISKKFDKWSPLINLKTPILPAKFKNNAGIIGSAMAAAIN